MIAGQHSGEGGTVGLGLKWSPWRWRSECSACSQRGREGEEKGDVQGAVCFEEPGLCSALTSSTPRVVTESPDMPVWVMYMLLSFFAQIESFSQVPLDVFFRVGWWTQASF